MSEKVHQKINIISEYVMIRYHHGKNTLVVSSAPLIEQERVQSKGKRSVEALMITC